MIRILLTLAFLAFIVASPVTRAQILVPAPEPAMLECQIDFSLRNEFAIYRLAGLTKEEAKVSVGFSMRVADYYTQEIVAQGGPLPDRTLEEQRVFADQLIEEVYAMEPFSKPIVNAWSSNAAAKCLEEAEGDIRERYKEEKEKKRRGEMAV